MLRTYFINYFCGKRSRLLFGGILLLSFSSCSSLPSWISNPFGDDDDATAPADLLDIQSEVNIDREWTVNVGNGQGDNGIAKKLPFGG